MTPAPFEAPTLEDLAVLLPAYDFESFIAQGGMGAVYKARQRSLDRDVAIKILPRELGEDPEFRQSFETEARAMARLNHPNLIGVYDSGDVDGMLYIVMEYVNGKSLYYSAYNLAVDPPQAADLVKGICDGLAHAHEHGVIHRDIKPANILLTPKREPKIGDFGLARPSGAEGPGLIMGTPGYTAPEVLKNPEHADRRSDLYAVGVILYELLTGQRQEPNSPPPSTGGRCDRALDTIWQKATHPNPAFRYPDAAQMAKDLDAWLAKAPGAAQRKLVAAGPRPVPGVPRPSPAATSIPYSTPSSGGGNLVRNLVVIAGLVVAIALTWKHLEKTKIERAEADRVAALKADEEKLKAEAERAAALAAAKASQPKPAPTRQETPLESLDRLQDSLAEGDRDEMPLGSVRRGDADFFVVPTPMTWQAAAAFAEEHGGHLAILAEEGDLGWVSNQVPKDVKDDQRALWIGTGRAGRSAWSQADGSPWKFKEPTGTGLYLAVDDLGLARTRKADDKLPFLIQWQRDGSNPADLGEVLKRTRASLDQPAPLFPPGTLAYENRHVLVVLRETEAAEAAELAEAGGGHLMVPALRDEAEWLAEQLAPVNAEEGLWLGATRDGAEWKWTTGEAWSFALWDSGFPKRVGDALTVLPGRGWRDADADHSASGFIIEWSKDRDAAAGKSDTDSGAPRVIASSDLAAKSKELLNGLDRDRKRDLAANANSFGAALEAWLRRLNETDNRRWRVEVARLKELVVDDRIPNGIDDDDDVKLSQEMADNCVSYLAKQKTIDATFTAKAERIREAYLVRLKEAHADAKIRGQTELAETIEEQAEEADNLDDWLDTLGIDSSNPDEEDEEEDDREGLDSDFVGKWIWNDSPGIVWEVSADGSIACRNWGNLTGRWTGDDGEVDVTWRSGGRATLTKRGKRWVGVNGKGDKIELEETN